jgi:hypothetical protein
VGRDEELEHRQTLAEVGLDRPRDDLALGVGHQALHAGDLAQLHPVASGTGVDHPEDGVGPGGVGDHLLGDLVGRLVPDLDEVFAALVVGHRTAVVELLHLGGAGFVLLDDLGLARRRDDVGDRDRRARAGGPVETGLLERVEGRGDLDLGVALGQVVDDHRQTLLVDRLVDERVVDRQGLVEHRSAQGGLQGDDRHPALFTRFDTLGQLEPGRRHGVEQPDLHQRAQLDVARVERHPGLGRRAERAQRRGALTGLRGIHRGRLR